MSNISIVNLSAYTSPQIQENKKSNYIEYGSDNNYFQYLIDRYLYSATNGAIITGVTNMIYGKGLDALDSNKKPNEYAQMKSIVKDSDLKKIALEKKAIMKANLNNFNELPFFKCFEDCLCKAVDTLGVHIDLVSHVFPDVIIRVVIVVVLTV